MMIVPEGVARSCKGGTLFLEESTVAMEHWVKHQSCGITEDWKEGLIMAYRGQD